MKKWFQPILDALETEQLLTELPFATVFECVYLPAQKLVLHFIPLKKNAGVDQDYFVQKSREAAALQLKCIHIREDVLKRHPELVIARIRALTGNRKRIHARATQGKRIDKPTAELFLDNNHMQQWVNAYYKFGLYHKDELVAVATFSKSRTMLDGVVPYRSYELIRFASSSGVTVTGGLSKLLNLFIQEVQPAHIMTYTDNDWGTGEGFEKLGFSLVETIPPIPFYTDPETLELFTEKQISSDSHNLVRVYNSGSNKYVLDRRDYTS
jgi:hypothetical protein